MREPPCTPSTAAVFSSQWGEEGEQLYDYENDPEEKHNLAADPQLAHLKQRLAADLARRIE